MMDCPICGREMRVTPHLRMSTWTPAQILLVEKLRALGASSKLIQRVVGPGCTPHTISSLEARRRLERRGRSAAA
jgi:hypothetical protein